ncbi:MAG: hypothetical protein K6G88_11320, partial [Lachnospiraceae bacterium]|nr:hypothetical protein [Lachnospiraceae bacterium]
DSNNSQLYIEYEYDNQNNLISKSDNTGTVNYCYNKNGKLVEMSTPSDLYEFDRDELNRIKSVNATYKYNSPTKSRLKNESICYEYDADGNKTSIIYNDGSITDYSYDEIGNIVKVVETDSNSNNRCSVSYNYNVFNNVVLMQNDNFAEKYTYDKNQRLKSVEQILNKSTYSDLYEYDAVGNITFHKEYGKYSGNPKEYTYKYDNTNKLIAESVKTNTETTDISYEYDAVGNLVLETNGNNITEYTYDNFGKLTYKKEFKDNKNISNVSYNYDKRGNLISAYDTNIGFVFRGKYNGDNQLVEAKTRKDSLKEKTSSYKYDGLGNLRYLDTATFVGNYYVNDIHNISLTYDYTEENPTVIREGNQDLSAYYIYGVDNKKVLSSVSKYNYSAKDFEVEKNYSLETDKLGSVRGACCKNDNDSFSVEGYTEYDTWGNIISNKAVELEDSGDKFDVTRSYTGHLYDKCTESWYTGAREYSPEIKRFTTVDPENGIIIDPITTLKYLYAEDNPVVKADYNGRSTSSFLNINKMFSADVKSTFCTTACSMAGDLLDLAKHGAATACEFTYNLVTSAYKGATIVMNSISNFYDSVPWQAKVAITACGMALAIASGVGVGFVASTVIKSAFSLAAINAGTSIISQMLTRQSVDVNEVMQSAERGFLDGAFTAGIFLGAIGTAQIGGKVISHPAVREFVARKKSYYHNWMVDESGGVQRIRVGERRADELVHVYRGTNRYTEISVFEETGQLMSDATRNIYLETGNLKGAYAQSNKIHNDWLTIWENENDYVQAHAAFGTELSEAFGLDRTFMSVTTDVNVARQFAGEGGRVFEAYIPRSQLIKQTLSGAGESEYLIRFGSGGFK